MFRTLRALALACLIMPFVALPALAQTTLTPPYVNWGGVQKLWPSPSAIIGYDSGTGLPCVVGSTPTCSLQALSGLVVPTASAPISSTSATTTLLLAGSNNKAIYVFSPMLTVSGAGTVNFISGSGATCGTSTTFLTGATGHPMSFAANGGFVNGGLAFIIPAAATGLGLCMVTTGAVDTSGSFAYAQQ